MKKLSNFFVSTLFVLTANAANGDVTNGWLMVEDFENSPTVSLYNVSGYTPTGTVAIVENPTDASNKVVTFSEGDYNTAIELDVTLPEGKTLSDYTQVAFDLYIPSHASDNNPNYKNMLVQIDDNEINRDTSYPKQAEIEEWTEKTYNISLGSVGNTFKLRLGLLVGGNTYYIDNVRFKEYEEPGTTHNGEEIDGWLMVEDFEATQSVSLFNYMGYTATGTATITTNPTASNEKVVSFVGGDYNTVIELDVTLPDEKTLSDYSEVAFDIYLNENASDNFQYKNILVWADEFVIHQDDSYPQVAEPEEWTEKAYSISTENNNIGNSFKLRLGVLTNDGDYYIDDVRLKPITVTGTTGIAKTDIDGTSVSIVAGGIIVSSAVEAGVVVCDIAGRIVSNDVVSGSKHIRLVPGVYIVSVGGQASKVLVK